jgi:hypothetical protein
MPFGLASDYDEAAPPEHPSWLTCSEPSTTGNLTASIAGTVAPFRT